MESKEPIRLIKFLEKDLPHYFPNKGEFLHIIQTIADATIPIRGLLEKGITSREIQYRMKISAPQEDSRNIYDEEQIHEDVLTHSIILKTLRESGIDFAFIASEEAEPYVGNGYFGITTDPVDGSSNVAVNRTVGTIVGIYNKEGNIICGMYVLYGIFTNLIIAVNGKVMEFVLDKTPYSMDFYHFIFHDYFKLPDPEKGGIYCLGGNPTRWSDRCRKYEEKLRSCLFKNRYSGSFVSDVHSILYYGGVYGYFPSPKPKIRLYYEWLPLAFIVKTLGGEFLIIDDKDDIKTMENIDPLTRDNVLKIHSTVCGGLVGSKKAVDFFSNI
ncbi:MAG: hypothetical protein ACP6IY_08430 [Promethearchaeia archaeon]